MIGFSVAIDTGGVATRFDAGLDAVRRALGDVAAVLAAELLDSARALASGDVLQVRSSAYRASLGSRVTQGDDSVIVGLTADAPEASLFEYGGTIPAHDIVPDAATALRFMGNAGAIYAAVVHDPGARIAPRPVLHDAYDAMADDIATRLAAVVEAF